jgi:hypothetical protein
MTAAAAATATIIIELEDLSRMMVSFCLAVYCGNGICPMNPELALMVAIFGIGRKPGCG